MTSTVETQAEKVADTPVDNVTSPTAEEKEKLGEAGKSPTKKAAATVRKADWEKDKIYLYQFTRCPTIASASPFCLKVETFLRMTNLTYENIDHKMKYKSKKGQLPFIELNGKEIADSDLIIKELSEKFEKNLDEGLTAEQKVTSHAFESMLNNHTSWVVRWWRYNNPSQFLEIAKLDVKQAVKSVLPRSLLSILVSIGFKSVSVDSVFDSNFESNQTIHFKLTRLLLFIFRLHSYSTLKTPNTTAWADTAPNRSTSSANKT